MKKKKAKHRKSEFLFWAIVKEFLKAKAREIKDGLGSVWEIIWIGGGMFGILALSMVLLGLPEYFIFHDTSWWKKLMGGSKASSMWEQIMLGGMTTAAGLAVCGIIVIIAIETFKWLRDNWVDATDRVKSERRWGRD
jgi:hypothetical protein